MVVRAKITRVAGRNRFREGRSSMVDETIPRRDFLKGAVVGTAALATGGSAAAQTAAPAPSTSPSDAEPLLTLTATEHAFVVAAVDTLIPADELSPSGSECGV